MIIHLETNKPFVEYCYAIKHNGVNDLYLLNRNDYNYFYSAYSHYVHPIILTSGITYLSVEHEFTYIRIVLNKNLLSFKTKCTNVDMTKINSKLSQLVFIGYFVKPLELSKKLNRLIFSNAYNKLLILPKHLKYLS